MNRIDLTIVVPSIRKERIYRLYDSISLSIGEDYIFQFIVAGPHNPRIPNSTFVYDLGSPSRATQHAIESARGEFVTWGTDDGIYKENALKECLDLIYSLEEKDGVIVKYTEEGPPNSITGADDEYYLAWTHRDQRIPGIPKDFKIAPVGMYNTKYFKEMGGLDCSFDHINMNTHDLAFRIQKDGGRLYCSPSVVMHCDSNNADEEHLPLDIAHRNNDVPKFCDLYDTGFNLDRIKIDFDNWKNSPSPWSRFK